MVLNQLGSLSANQKSIQDDPQLCEDLRHQNMYNAKYLLKRQQVQNYHALLQIAGELNMVSHLMKQIKAELKSNHTINIELLCSLGGICFLFGLEAVEVTKPNFINCFIKMLIEVVAPEICQKKSNHKADEAAC